ncbi:MAG TPA: single-stranded-DNA-specific exonuclease RecJ [Arenicellales bacterium]|nr:single-stranded-DNA-specific exonuclease RecJ [Arenicellales bacterium]
MAIAGGGAAVELRRREAAGSGPSGLPQWLARVYAARRVTRDQELDYALKGLARPGELSGLEQALDILMEAVMADARITFVGDFDADGATSCALGVGALRAMGAGQVDYLVPNRFDFGYGLSPEIVGKAAGESEPDVIITVDNGIGSHAGVLAAQQLGITTIITDHHLPGETLPQADAIVNPNNPGDGFPSKCLAGVGVIFYVMTALRSRLRADGWFRESGIAEPNLAEYLDLVALGTVADMVTLDRNNRILVSQGLARIRGGRARPGIRALLEVAGKDPANLGSRDLGFSIAPRLNAAGRLEDMTEGIECLMTDDMDYARRLARQLDETNQRRREMQSDMVQQAEEAVARMHLEASPDGVALYDESWHQGIVGLIASRVTELTRRPAIAFAPAGEAELKGSARSVSGVHIRDVLAAMDVEHEGLIERFGGHAMAAGLSIRPDRFERFQGLFGEYVGRFAGEALDGPHVVYSDGPLAEDEIDVDNARLLQEHGPWGQGFPEPLFDDTFEVLERRIVGSGFVRYRLRLPDGRKVFTGICFKPPETETAASPPDRIHAAYRLSLNDYNGTLSAQLIVEYVWSVTGDR